VQVDVVGQLGVDVAERVVAERRQVDHRVEAGQVPGRDVTQVHPDGGHRFGGGTQQAVGVEPDVQAGDRVPGGAQAGAEHAADVALVAGDEYPHELTPRERKGVERPLDSIDRAAVAGRLSPR
jgi:hypothetical protein